MKTICVISLGCPKNLVDSEKILALTAEKGLAVVAEPEQADVVVLNTCAFLQKAVAESRQYLRQLVKLKKRKKQKLLVVGCLVQREGRRLLLQKEIDALVGTGDPAEVARALEDVFSGKRPFRCVPGTFLSNKAYPRLVTTAPYAYLKIAEGCSNFCRYCLIPALRGPLRSFPLTVLLSEAKALRRQGLKELILVAQDTAAYGRETGRKGQLAFLLKKLCQLGFPWVRLLYAHPAHLKDDVLEVMLNHRCFCRYLDLPFQHAHPEMLAKMGRPVIDARATVEWLRKTVPGLRLRSSFLVGFPGEKEKHFQFLVDFLRQARLDRVGVFGYSREKGTAAYHDRDQLPGQVIRERRKYLLQVQREISREKMKELVGQTLPVLVEKKARQFWLGRTEFDAPEIDGLVKIRAEKLTVGEFVPVKITGSDDYDLEGQVCLKMSPKEGAWTA
ncbi:MAG TPA: 30S ribosomal protein S12 methylthiotransferase RimO [bacterium]|nr:30S ribosomal protein S12 methylthiotransferase RimO [bacterium]HOL66895.1 30S ribosomal protein S12 methylthiotransferase RimO [bacterium]HPP12938.1 30S ribosomal protein S12 methylthiotransferase RimO [bacterium]